MPATPKTAIPAPHALDRKPQRAASRPRLQKLRVLAALIMREMSSRYGKSWGGYFWAVAEPAAGILILAIIFGYALHRPPLGNSFMLFYATGIIPFYLFNAVATSVSTAVQQNKGLLNYAVVTALDTVFARVLLETLTYFAVSLMLFPLLIWLDRAVVSIDLLQIVIGMGMAIALGLGVGIVNAVAFAFFPTWRNIWAVLRRPLFIMSGILFTFSMVPLPYRDWLWWNPIIHVVGQMRMGFYRTYEGEYISWVFVMATSMVLFTAGCVLLRRHEGAMIER
jgi:capsular polysaccharide transport system permease protein